MNRCMAAIGVLCLALAACSPEKNLAACKVDAIKATVQAMDHFDRIALQQEIIQQCMIANGYALRPREGACDSTVAVVDEPKCYRYSLF